MGLGKGLIGGSREEEVEEELMITWAGERWREEEQRKRVSLKRDTVAMIGLWWGVSYIVPLSVGESVRWSHHSPAMLFKVVFCVYGIGSRVLALAHALSKPSPKPIFYDNIFRDGDYFSTNRYLSLRLPGFLFLPKNRSAVVSLLIPSCLARL